MLSIEDAIYKMTGLSAKMMNLSNRGVLEEGFAGDVTIFDKDKISDMATYDNPFQKPVGIDHVIVNGKLAVYNGLQTETRNGQFLLNK